MKIPDIQPLNRYQNLILLIFVPLTIHSLNLTIVHNNDFHSQFEEMNAQRAQCQQNEPCFGGVARIVTQVRKIRNGPNGKNVLFLNAGDNFAGTIWYTLEKWRVVAELVKLLKFDAMTLGNHEFDDGFKQLLPFLRVMKNNEEKNVSIVCSNLKLWGEVQQLIKRSIVVKRENTNIAIIGYLTPKTAFLSLTEKNIQFNNEIKSIKKEIKVLKKKYGNKLNIFIGLGHSGIQKDKEIAQKIPELDVVVGGHSHTFLFTGKQPSNEVPEGPYPIVIDHKGMSKTLVVQAYQSSKYLGKLDVSFDENGIITKYGGNPILLDESIEQDPIASKKVKKKAKKINEHYNSVLGYTLSELDGSKCRFEECSVGSLFNDAFVSYFARKRNYTKEQKGWTAVPIALYNGGGIRTGISLGNITRKDIITSLSFGNFLGILKINGQKLWDILEHSASQHKNGGFLQVSGIRYCFDSGQPIGKRLRSVRVRCADCKTPFYEDLEKERMYSILTSEYLVTGGDDYSMIKGSEFTRIDRSDYELVFDYVQNYSPIMIGIEDRIINTKGDCFGSSSTPHNNT